MRRLGARGQGGAAMSARAFAVVPLVPGAASGPILRLDEPLSFWGGLDSATGTIIDRLHPQRGACVAGRVLMMPTGRGSSSGSATLAEALRLGNGPAAILMLERDAIVVVGAMVAAELYGLACPVALANGRDWRALAAAARLTLEAGRTALRSAPTFDLAPKARAARAKVRTVARSGFDGDSPAASRVSVRRVMRALRQRRGRRRARRLAHDGRGLRARHATAIGLGHSKSRQSLDRPQEI